jgi:hypothetical protein
MIRRLPVLIIFMILIPASCFKSGTRDTTTTTVIEINSDLTDREWIRELSQEIAKSRSLNVEVFIAISICHNDFINQFAGELDKMSEEQKKEFLLKKKEEYFKTIHYTEEEYSRFMSSHWDELKKYVDENPHLQQYLISTN